MKKFAFVAVIGLVFGLVAFGISACGGATAPAPQATQSEPAAVSTLTPGDAFVCPMHPEVTSGTPGDCPKCGMHLVPMAEYMADPAHADHGHEGSTAVEHPAATAPSATATTSSATSAAPAYVCPMHPEVTSDVPGDCPKCGMHLTKSEDAAR